MEEKYKLEKEYSIPPELFDEAYKAYQKKFVYKKNYIFMCLFLVLAADFVYAAVKQPSNTMAYLLIVVCIALAFREWHNPRFIRRRISDTVRSMGKVVYKIGVGSGFVDISTVDMGFEDDDNDDDTQYHSNDTDTADPENSADDDDDNDIIENEQDMFPEKSRINTDDGYRLLEYDNFFLLMQDKKVFYILPKTGFSEDELQIIRDTDKIHN